MPHGTPPPSRKPAPDRARTGPTGVLARSARTGGRVALACLIAVLAANALIFLGYRIVVWTEHWTRSDDSGSDNVVVERHQVPLDAVYPGLAPHEIDAMLEETWSRGLVYDADAVFREGPLDGAYVTVDPAGFRHSADQSPWPPGADAPVVFVGGGSTTFGYGLPDGDTVASALSRRLRALPELAEAQIYNFGRGYFFSKIEQRLFTGLVGHGHVPDIAIFIDGLNEFQSAHGGYPGPNWSAVGPLRDGRPIGLVTVDWPEVVHKVPMLRLARDVAGWLDQEPPAPDATPAAFDPAPYADPQVLDAVIDRYLHQQRLIRAVGDAFATRLVFVWQPVPTYAYDLDRHPFVRQGRADGTAPIFGDHNRSAYGYRRFADRLASDGLPPDMVWCADITADSDAPLYVDAVHYGALLSDMLAACIVEGMQ